MKNNMNINDELLIELPDYISGELKDDKMRSQIEDQIKNNPTFKAEYESMRSALNFLQEAEHSSPDEVYFANLQSRILSKTSAREKSVPFYAKVLSYWKYLIPAVTVCIVILVYSNMNNTVVNPIATTIKKDTQQVTTPQNTSKTNTEAVTENQSELKEDLADLYYSPDEDYDDVAIAPSTRTKNNIRNTQPNNNIQNLSKEDLNQMEINLFNDDSDDNYYEDDFRSLSPDEQKVILEELKNTNI